MKEKIISLKARLFFLSYGSINMFRGISLLIIVIDNLPEGCFRKIGALWI